MLLPQLLILCFGYYSRDNSNNGGGGGVMSFVFVPHPRMATTTTVTSQATLTTTTSKKSSTVTLLQLNQLKQQLSSGGGDAMPPEVYPLSRKKVLLIEEAKRLNASLSPSSSNNNNYDATQSTSTSTYYYSPAGWSNRLGSVLTPASIPGVYTADRPFYWNKIDVGCRMTVVQLSSPSSSSSTSQTPESSLPKQQLLVHSPVHLDPPLIDALSKLGTVSHIISPNYEHVKYAQEWAEYYPNAKVWGCPGLRDRMPRVRWTGEVMEGTRPPGFYRHQRDNAETTPTTADTSTTTTTTTESSWIERGYINGMWNWEDVQPMHIDTEKNPFTGRPFFNEVVFYHTSSKTLIVTDLYWNYPRGDGVTNGDFVVEDGEDSSSGADAAAAAASSSSSPAINDDGDFGVWELAPNVGNIPLGSKVWGKIGMDKLFYPFYMNVMITQEKRQTFEEIARYITCGGDDDDDNDDTRRGWEVETIIPAHGDIVRGKTLCRRVLERHFRIQCRSS